MHCVKICHCWTERRHVSAFSGCSKQRERVLAAGPWVTWAQGRSKQALERLPGSVLAFSLTNTSLGFKGEAPRGSGGCGGVRGVHGSLYISLVTSLPARCWLQGGVEGCLHISLLETAGTQQQDDQTSWCPVRVRRHHRLSSACLYFWFSVFEIKRRWQILKYCWDLKELPPHEGSKPFDEYKPAVRCCSAPHLA